MLEDNFPETQKLPNVLLIPKAAKVSLCPTPVLKDTICKVFAHTSLTRILPRNGETPVAHFSESDVLH